MLADERRAAAERYDVLYMCPVNLWTLTSRHELCLHDCTRVITRR